MKFSLLNQRNFDINIETKVDRNTKFVFLEATSLHPTVCQEYQFNEMILLPHDKFEVI